MTNRELKDILERYPDDIDVFVNGSSLNKIVMTETSSDLCSSTGEINLISRAFEMDDSKNKQSTKRFQK